MAKRYVESEVITTLNEIKNGKSLEDALSSKSFFTREVFSKGRNYIVNYIKQAEYNKSLATAIIGMCMDGAALYFESAPVRTSLLLLSGGFYLATISSVLYSEVVVEKMVDDAFSTKS